MKNFCTLFDSHYFSRGLAAYYSLLKHCKSFHLYIFAFDNLAYDVLKKMNLSSVTVISLLEFEDKELLVVKKNRSIAEYCWTCTPSVIKYVFDNYELDSCTYIDSDLYFFSDPSVLFEENKDCSVMITEHRFSENYLKYEVNGIYNVQFMFFKNNEDGKKVIEWWRQRCIEWCFAKLEEGKFGDQKYLDDWTTRFNGVHVLQNTGGGVAPWNVQNYSYDLVSDKVVQTDLKSEDKNVVIFYHFHNFKIYKEGFSKAINYPLSKNLIEYGYKKYYQNLLYIESELEANYPEIASKGFIKNDMDSFTILSIISRMKKGDFSGNNIIVGNNKKFNKMLKSNWVKIFSTVISKIFNKVKKLIKRF